MSELKDFLNGGGSLAPQVNENTAAIVAKAGYNFIINGCAEVSQRYNDTITGVTDGSLPVDGWSFYNNSGVSPYAVDFTRASGSYPIPSIVNSQKYTITSVKTPAAGDALLVDQTTESANTTNLISNEFVVSFWMKSNKVGIRPVVLVSANFDYTYTTTVSISTANTWEFKQFVVVGGLPSTISWKNNSVPSRGVILRFPLSAGSSGVTSSLNTWVNSNKYWASGAADLATDANSYLEITGVKIELGNTPTNYILSIEDSLTKCLRRFQRVHLKGLTKQNGGVAGESYIGGSWYVSPKIASPVISFDMDGQASKVSISGALASIASGGFYLDAHSCLIADAIVGLPSVNWWETYVTMDCYI